MVFDYKVGSQQSEAGFSVKNGVLSAEDGYGRGACFKNYPVLRIRGLHLLDCTFEDCGRLIFDVCDLMNCTIRRVEHLDATESKFIHCHFEELRGSEGSIMELDETEIRKSEFYDIELLGEAYLCESDFESLVQDCSFKNCRTDRKDLELFYCEIEKGLLFKRKKEVSIVLSSMGLENVLYIGDDEKDDDEDGERTPVLWGDITLCI